MICEVDTVTPRRRKPTTLGTWRLIQRWPPERQRSRIHCGGDAARDHFRDPKCASWPKSYNPTVPAFRTPLRHNDRDSWSSLFFEAWPQKATSDEHRH